MKSISILSLSGVRVLDLTDERGWFCGKLLADMGAEITFIEKPGFTSQDILNTRKKRVALDIETLNGIDHFIQLTKTSDVLIESFAPCYLDSLGLAYTELNKINPKIIMASITPFGQTGPYCDYKTSDLVAAALGGWMSVCGEKDTPPLKPFGRQAYYTACLFAANGILLALHERHSSGKGQYLDISIHECVAGTLDHVLVRYFYQGEVADRHGSLYWNNTFRVFPCKDGFVFLTLFYQWETLIEWMKSEGKAEDLKDARWLKEEERQININHIIKVLERWTLSHNVTELVEQGQLMHFPWANIATINEVVKDPQLNARNFFKRSYRT